MGCLIIVVAVAGTIGFSIAWYAGHGGPTGPTTTATASVDDSVTVSNFRGGPAECRVWFDLTGIWHVIRFKNPEDTAKTSRWEETWTLARNQVPDGLFWRDTRGAAYYLTIGDVPQFLHTDQLGMLSINRVSFGLLMMTDENGSRYMAMRTDGGEDLPTLTYPGESEPEPRGGRPVKGQ